MAGQSMPPVKTETVSFEIRLPSALGPSRSVPQRDRQALPHSISFGGSMANAFPSVSRIGDLCCDANARLALQRWDAPNLSGEEQFQRAGRLAWIGEAAMMGRAATEGAAFYR